MAIIMNALVRIKTNGALNYYKMVPKILNILPVNIIQPNCYSNLLLVSFRIPIWIQTKSSSSLQVRWLYNISPFIAGNRIPACEKLLVNIIMLVNHTSK